MRALRNRDYAHRRLSMVLRLQGLWRSVETEAWGLLRILFLRNRAMPAYPRRKELLWLSQMSPNKPTVIGPAITKPIFCIGDCPPLLWWGEKFVPHPAKTLAWIAALLWMGFACLVNTHRCSRIHCCYTGPVFLNMVISVFLHGFGVLSLGHEGWVWLGNTIGMGTAGIWFFQKNSGESIEDSCGR